MHKADMSSLLSFHLFAHFFFFFPSFSFISIMDCYNDDNEESDIRLENLPNELIEMLFKRLKNYNDRLSLSQLNDTFKAQFVNNEQYTYEEYDSKKRGLIVNSVMNNEAVMFSNKMQAAILHTSDFPFRCRFDKPRFFFPEQILSFKSLTRIIHDSDYNKLHLDVFKGEVMDSITQFSFIDKVGHLPYLNDSQEGEQSSCSEYQFVAVIETDDIYERNKHVTRTNFMYDILKILYSATNIEHLTIYNSYMHECLYPVLACRSITVLKLVNITYLIDKELEYFLSRCNSLKTFFFYAESDKRNKRQLRNTTVEIVYNYIHRLTDLAHLRLNVIGSETPYANLLKLKKFQHCAFVVDKFEDTKNFRNIIEHILTDSIEIYLQDLSAARHFLTKRVKDESFEYAYHGLKMRESI